MFEMISIVVVTLRQQQTIETRASIERLLPSLAVSNDASPLGWSQNWSHLLATAANHSRITTSNALRGLPWAQGVAGSNPVAPTKILRTSVNLANADRASADNWLTPVEVDLRECLAVAHPLPTAGSLRLDAVRQKKHRLPG